MPPFPNQAGEYNDEYGLRNKAIEAISNLLGKKTAMLDAFLALSGIEQVWWGLAILSSVAFAIKLVMSIMGIGGGMEALDAADAADVADAADPADAGDAAKGSSSNVPAVAHAFEGLNIFSLQNILAFFCLGSWTSIVTYNSTQSLLAASGIGLVVGILMMFACAWLMRAIFRLEENGNIQMGTAIGLVGPVYLTIPPAGKGIGKVNLVLDGSLKEYSAVSQDNFAIPTGTNVRVIGLNKEDDALIVQRESEELS